VINIGEFAQLAGLKKDDLYGQLRSVPAKSALKTFEKSPGDAINTLKTVAAYGIIISTASVDAGFDDILRHLDFISHLIWKLAINAGSS
jgi:hypothetical protein